MYVYIIQSLSNKSKTYIGVTNNFKRRLIEHNQGLSKYTSEFKPWKPTTVIWIKDPSKARKMEKYLKSGSGRAFTKKHF